jgi:uncharacterized protein YndB with AHSA1/START domain
MEKVYEIYIKTTPERLWEAITDSEQRQKYSFGVGIESDWTAGSSYAAVHPQAGIRISEGETSRSIRRGASSRASPRCGART